MINLKLNQILNILRDKGYKVFTRPFELNIVAERSTSVRSEKMDDTLHVFYRTANRQDNQGRWTYHHYLVTTDPSAYYIDNPIVPAGYGFIKKGQYVGAYQQGLHNGRPALVQARPITVIRNYAVKGLFKSIIGEEQTGIFGNNIHDMKGSMFNASAGCIVFASASDHQEFMQQVESHRRIYGNAFTLTLIDFRDQRKVRNTGLVAGALAIGGILTMGLHKKLM